MISKAIKQRARSKMTSAIYHGKLKRGVCVVCGTKTKIEGHHPNYRKPLLVVWLCKEHHVLAHSIIRAYQKKKRTRKIAKPRWSISCWLDVDLRRWILEYKKTSGRTISSIVCEALRNYRAKIELRQAA